MHSYIVDLKYTVWACVCVSFLICLALCGSMREHLFCILYLREEYTFTICLCVNVNPPCSRFIVLAGAPLSFLKWSKVLWENQRLSDPFAQQGLLLCGELEVSVSLEDLDPPLIHLQVHLCALALVQSLSPAVLRAKWILVSPTLGHAFAMWSLKV